MHINMKKSFLLFLTIFALFQVVDAQTTVEKIRKHYNEINSNVAEMATWTEEYPVPTFYHVEIQENYPGTGKHKEDVYIYHDEIHEESEDDAPKIFPPKRIEFVTVKYNFAARNFYREYLYDEKGNVEFIYAFNEYDLDDLDWEYRFYFNDGKLIKAIVKQKSSGSNEEFKEVYNGTSIPKEHSEYYEGFLDKSKHYKKMFDIISDEQHY